MKARLFVETDNDRSRPSFRALKCGLSAHCCAGSIRHQKLVATIRCVEVVDGEIAVTLANEAALRLAWESAGFFDPLS